MAEKEEDYSELMISLQRLKKRMADLEKDSKTMNEFVDIMDRKMLNGYYRLNEETELIKNNIKELNLKLNSITMNMEKVIQGFKDAVTKEDLELIESRVDELKFESYITKRDVEKAE